MKKNKYILMGAWMLCSLAASLAGCSDDATPEQPETDTWNVLLTRSTTDGNNVTVALRYGETTSYGILIPASQGTTTATWETKPKWPTDENTEVEVITFCPQVETLPETVNCMDNIMYKMDCVTCTINDRPETFEFTHLMAQLEVHIKINNDAEHHYTPTDGNINLYIKGTVNYRDEKLIPCGTVEAFSLGGFTKEGGTESVENWTNAAQLVIPQTLVAGEPCLTFKAGDKTYTFTPEEDIVLKPGKKTKLYLGVAYENDYIVLDGEGVTVTAWDNGEDFGNKEAE